MLWAVHYCLEVTQAVAIRLSFGLLGAACNTSLFSSELKEADWEAKLRG